MRLESYRIVFISISLIGILLFASPSIEFMIRPPAGEHFSVLYILGPNHKMEYIPYNIKADLTYSTFIGVENHMSKACYYNVLVKLSNSFDSDAASNSQTLYEYELLIQDNKTWEAPLVFKVLNLQFFDNKCNLFSINFNGNDYYLNSITSWDPENKGYFYKLIVELWIYDSNSGDFKFHNRSLSLTLNMTA